MQACYFPVVFSRFSAWRNIRTSLFRLGRGDRSVCQLLLIFVFLYCCLACTVCWPADCVHVLLLDCVLVLLQGWYCLLTCWLCSCTVAWLVGLLTCWLCSCTVAWPVLSADLLIVSLYCCLACTVQLIVFLYCCLACTVCWPADCVLVLLIGCVLVLLFGLYCVFLSCCLACTVCWPADCVLVLLLGLYCLLTCRLCSCTVAWLCFCTVAWLLLSIDLLIVFLYYCLACTVCWPADCVLVLLLCLCCPWWYTLFVVNLQMTVMKMHQFSCEVLVSGKQPFTSCRENKNYFQLVTLHYHFLCVCFVVVVVFLKAFCFALEASGLL